MQNHVSLRRYFAACMAAIAMVSAAHGASFIGNVVDSKTGATIPSRVYVQSESEEWFFPSSLSPNGSAVYYKKERVKGSVEMHTTLSAHPFKIELPVGKYSITVERGKEYRPLTRAVEMTDQPQDMRLPLDRWINLAERGWYSGDTHVHRTVEDLPNIMLAEDLNVTFPLTYWVTKAYEKPSQGNKNTEDKYGTDLIKVDDTHVIYPRNTEYEIFTVDGKRHTLGAVFVLGHKKVLEFGAPAVKPIAVARNVEDSALLDLDKHNWPWSMAIMPLLKVDLFELSNNHLWRTQFAFTNWAEPAPPYMKLNYHGTTGAEMAWTRFGFENYYALLNCGFNMKPTGGTASGVHPVPLGFGRVYVQLDGTFNYDDFRRGLKHGRSFVTTGPMLFVQANERHPGYTWKRADASQPVQMQFTGQAVNARPLSSIEILFNGQVVKTIAPGNRVNAEGGFESAIDFQTTAVQSGWFVARCWQIDDDGRFRFAHTAPWHVEISGKPLRPRKEQIDYLIQRVKDQIERSREVLPESAIAEYQEALQFYQDIANKK